MEKPRKILPLMYVFASLMLMIFVDWLLPVGIQTGALLWGFGACFVSVGIGLMIFSAALFRRAGTPLIPFHQTTAIVESGPFKVSRNPMYLGMTLAQLGVAIVLGNPLALVPLALFIWTIQKRFIEPEEHFMEELFGEAYLSYKSRVRRWF